MSGLSPSPFTILIVDDVPDSLAHLGDMLMPHYQVVATNFSASALRIAALQPRPDLLLIDTRMPGRIAYEVL